MDEAMRRCAQDAEINASMRPPPPEAALPTKPDDTADADDAKDEDMPEMVSA
jgi:hypothetical protein